MITTILCMPMCSGTLESTVHHWKVTAFNLCLCIMCAAYFGCWVEKQKNMGRMFEKDEYSVGKLGEKERKREGK